MSSPPLDFAYSSGPSQFCRVHLPSPAASASSEAGGASSGIDGKPDAGLAPLPVVLIIHGGFWKDKYNIDNAAHTTLAPSLAGSGKYVAIEMEYRRRDEAGYPGTLDDAAACLAHLPLLVSDHNLPLDLDRLCLVGHSAGGQLALWLADHASRAQRGIPSPAAAVLGADACAGAAFTRTPVPRFAVGVAPVSDMVAAYTRHLSDEGDAAELFMKCQPGGHDGQDSKAGGGTGEAKDKRGAEPGVEAKGANLARYHDASPMHRLPLTVPTIVVSGGKDTDVPTDMVAEYAAKATAANQAAYDVAAAAAAAAPRDAKPAPPAPPIVVEHLYFAEADHYVLMDAASEAWRAVRAKIDAAML